MDATEKLPTVNLEALELAAIKQALAQVDNNRPQACKLLGISIRTLQRKIVRLGLPAYIAAPAST